MSDWIFDRNDRATVILDSDRIRSSRGQVIAWISGNNVYTIQGWHCGRFEDGVLFDSHNSVRASFATRQDIFHQDPVLETSLAHPVSLVVQIALVSEEPQEGPARGGWSDEGLALYF